MEYKDTDTMKIMLFEISNLKGKDKFLTIAAVLADGHSLAILDFGSLPKNSYISFLDLYIAFGSAVKNLELQKDTHPATFMKGLSM